MNTNFLEIGACNGWLDGTCTGLRPTADGFLAMEEGTEQGVYLSPVIDAPQFENLVVSWNVSLRPDDFVRVEGRLKLVEKAQWTPWVSYGDWSPYLERKSCSGRYPEDNPVIRVNCDILETLDDCADAFQIRVSLLRIPEEKQNEALKNALPGPLESSCLRHLGAAIRNKKRPMIPVRETQINRPIEGKVVLSTPSCSQMVRDPEIGHSICNPTTMTVLLADRGVQVLPEVMAMSMVDMKDGFGNWAYDAAMGSMYGFRVFARFGDFESLRAEIDAGRSVGISVSYAKDPETAAKRDLPYLENAPCNTPGHILTVRGYSLEEGTEWVYVSDSAADSDPECFIRYRKDQFMNAWTGFHYVMDPTPEILATIPPFSATELVKAGGEEKTRYCLKDVQLSKELLSDKQYTADRGCLMTRQNRDYPAPRMDSNDLFTYPEVDEDGCFCLPEGAQKVYFLTNTGRRMIAEV